MIVSEGIQVLGANLTIFLISLFLIAVSAFAAVLYLSIAVPSQNIAAGVEDDLDIFDRISLGLSGAAIFLFIFSAPVVILGKTSIFLYAVLIMLLVIYGVQKGIGLHQTGSRDISGRYFVMPITFIAIFLLFVSVKFAYIYGLELPLNIDSVNHAYIIDQIVKGNGLQTLPYYHFGFHYIGGFISLLSGENIPKTILIFGQALQVMIPFVVYFPVHRITNNAKVALLCVLIAGLGFSMPSISTSWGKYPALLGILGFPYLVTVSRRVFEGIKSASAQKNRLGVIFAIGLVLASVLIHSRMLILLVGVALALFFDGRIKIDHRLKGVWMGILLIVFLAGLGHDNLSGQAFGSVLQPYKDSLILSGLLIALMPFSAWYYGRYTFRAGLLIGVLLLFFAIPTPEILADHYNATRWIDRPFLSIFLFLPLAILCGTGLAGVEKWAANRGLPIKAIMLAGLLMILLVFPNEKVLAPWPAAILAGEDDYRLYADIRDNLALEAQILIPNFAGYYYDRGLDGGAWVELITGRQVHPAAYDIDLTSYSVVTEICAAGAEYIYAGGKPYSFLAGDLSLRPDWFDLVFSYPNAKLYRLIGCFDP